MKYNKIRQEVMYSDTSSGRVKVEIACSGYHGGRVGCGRIWEGGGKAVFNGKAGMNRDKGTKRGVSVGGVKAQTVPRARRWNVRHGKLVKGKVSDAWSERETGKDISGLTRCSLSDGPRSEVEPIHKYSGGEGGNQRVWTDGSEGGG